MIFLGDGLGLLLVIVASAIWTLSSATSPPLIFMARSRRIFSGYTIPGKEARVWWLQEGTLRKLSDTIGGQIYHPV